MSSLSSFLDAISSAVKSFNIFSDLLDIVLVSYIIYKVIYLVRETRASQLVKGIFWLAMSYILSIQFDLRTMSFILKNVFQIGIIALIILFQPELRRMLEKVGRTQVSAFNMFSPEIIEHKSNNWIKSIKHICEAMEELSKTKTGALMVLEKTTRLGEQIGTGVYMDSHITVELLLNIFYVNTPLHDGAVIVRDGKIVAAACFLPKPQNEEGIANTLGSRHRAAIGISEISDAITIVVSEENGTISITENGELIRNFTKETLNQFLVEKLVPKVVPRKEIEIKPIKPIKSKKKNNPKKDTTVQDEANPTTEQETQAEVVQGKNEPEPNKNKKNKKSKKT